MAAVEIVVTGPRGWVQLYVTELLEARLVACAQVWPMNSRYWWQGRIDEAEEVRVAMHAPQQSAQSLIARIEEAHPYEVPCILAIPIPEGNANYLQWIHRSTVKLP